MPGSLPEAVGREGTFGDVLRLQRRRKGGDFFRPKAFWEFRKVACEEEEGVRDGEGMEGEGVRRSRQDSDTVQAHGATR